MKATIFLACVWISLTSAIGTPAANPRISPKGTCHVVALFARFPDEDPQQTTPPSYAQHLFDPERPGSFTHFYHEMSLGKLTIEGAVLPTYYTSHRSPSGYVLTEANKRKGYFGTFNREILEEADRDVDFGRFDNDGPDGLPNSGDDDGCVDFLFMMVRSNPPGFLAGTATGAAELGLEEDFITNDPASSGYIRITADLGATQRVWNFEHAVGVMAHEFGHALGLPDLYDRCYRDFGEDAAGIGNWGIMGRGALGWNGRGGPVPFCAWSREQLGWANVIEITQDVVGQVLTDVATTGAVYKVPLGEGGSYYLLENRQSTRSHYDRDIPQDGLLIWHVQPYVQNPREPNGDEERKMVDLVCADGLYRDRGYPYGAIADPDAGRDNLDFWAHDEGYRDAHTGNLGDATDVFDGIRFAAFTPHTNPSSRRGVWIESIRPTGTDLIADIQVPRWSGSITQDITWEGVLNVVGDILIQEGVTLTILPGTVVRFSPTDLLRSGRDRDRCEMDVFGSIKILGRGDPVRFTAEGEGIWAGIRLHEETASVSWSMGLEIRVEDCEYSEGIFWSRHRDAKGPEILDWTIQDDRQGGNGNGALDPGETVGVVLNIQNWTIKRFRVHLSTEDPSITDCASPPVETVIPGRSRHIAGFLTLDPDCLKGHRISLKVDFMDLMNADKVWTDTLSLMLDPSQETTYRPNLVTDVGEDAGFQALPISFALNPNYPNPFNAQTVISFDLPQATDLTLTIFNAAGQRIRQWQGSWSAGYHSLTWDGQDEDGAPVASGVYFYCLQAEGFIQTYSATVLR